MRAPTTTLLIAALTSLVVALPAAPATAADDGWSIDSGVATWTSPEPLPAGGARPEVVLGGRVLLGTTLAADGRTVSVRVPAGTETDELDVVLSGRVLDEPGRMPKSDDRAVTTDLDQGPDLGLDPAAPGPYRTATSDYSADSLSVPGYERPLEVRGHVVRPAAGQVDDSPLVLLLHGRHAACYDPAVPDPDNPGSAWPCPAGEVEIRNDLGYGYLQQLLASQGYTTVSVSANALSSQDSETADSGAIARAAVVRRHLDLWAQRDDLRRGTDLDRVVLLGHSRGGEGVDLAAQTIALDAPYRVVGEVLVAPVDFARRTAPYVPSVTLLPYCDGDVGDLQGQRYTDLARGLAPGDTALKSSVLVMGANHNFFNTEWTPGETTAPTADDWRAGDDPTCGASRSTTRLDAGEQREVAAAYVAGAVQLFTGEAPDNLAMFDGTPGHVGSTGRAVVRSHAVGGGRQLVLPSQAWVSGSRGASVRLCRGTADLDDRVGCADVAFGRAPHWVEPYPPGLPTQSALESTWSRAGAVTTLGLRRPWDLSRAAYVDLRAVAAGRTATVAVRLQDAAGGQATVVPANGGKLPALPGRPSVGLARLVATQLRVPLAGVEGVDLRRVTAVSLVARSATGKVWVLDVAGTPAALPAVPDRRLPVLDLGDLTTTEASGTGNRTARVPFTLTGDVSRPSRFRVLAGERVLTVKVPAGARRGSVPVPYVADAAWSSERFVQLQAFPLAGVSVRDGAGLLELRDDDPVPVVSSTAPTSVVEGDTVTLVLRLSHPVAEPVSVALGFERPETGPRADVADLHPAWARRFVDRSDPDAPLWERSVDVEATFEPGQRELQLQVRTRADTVAEQPERLTLGYSVGAQLDGGQGSRTVVLQER